jgi:hypothetical protein
MFTEVSYVPSSGVHMINFDLTKYSPFVISTEDGKDKMVKQFSQRISMNKGSVVSSDAVTGQILFSVERDDIIQMFRNRIKMSSEKTLYRRRFIFPEAVMSTAVNGVITFNSGAEALAAIKDKVAE